jgi:hypothetical protein
MKRHRALTIACLAAALGATAATAWSEEGDKLVQGRMLTDGVLTVSQPETVSVTGLPKKTKLAVQLLPAGGMCSSANVGLCIPPHVVPAPGTPRFRTSAKGRATLMFVTPDHYDFFRVRGGPAGIQSIQWTNGQSVQLLIAGRRHRHHGLRDVLGFAVVTAAIEVPPPPGP